MSPLDTTHPSSGGRRPRRPDPFAASLLARPAWLRLVGTGAVAAVLWAAVLWAVAVP